MQHNPKKILLCITGLSPQIVTETLYALAVTKQDAWIPDEVHIITTKEGEKRVKLSLLNEKTGYFHRFIKDYKLNNIKFDDSTIHVLKDENKQPLNDIRTPEHNTIAADWISNIIFNFTKNNDNHLHVSLAGGRKTMGFYVGYALSLYGRAQDQLSHVLVSEGYESHPEFYYPTKESHVIYSKDNKNSPMDTKDAHVTLANIPFVRMHEGRNKQFEKGTISFSKAVEQAQEDISNLSVQINIDKKELTVHGKHIKLGNNALAYYWWLIEKSLNNKQGTHWSEDGITEEFLSYYSQLENEDSGNFDKTKTALKLGIDQSYFETKKSKINTILKKALGERIAQPYLIDKLNKIEGTQYTTDGIILNETQVNIIKRSN